MRRYLILIEPTKTGFSASSAAKYIRRLRGSRCLTLGEVV